jgi:hypothetical protein
LIQQQGHGIGIQFFALLGQGATAPGMQRGHEREQQRAGGEVVQTGHAPDSIVEEYGTTCRITCSEASDMAHVAYQRSTKR